MNVNDYWREVNRVYRMEPEWRYGQTACNVLYVNFPELANSIRGTASDPFNIGDSTDLYTNPIWDRFVTFVNSAIPDHTT